MSLDTGDSVVCGERFEPPKYYEQNQSIKKPRAYRKTRGLIFYL